MDYEVIWHGSKQGPNRGYLCTVADQPRDPSALSVLEDWSPNKNRKPSLTLRARVEAAIDGYWMTSQELQKTCDASVTGIAVVLQWLKRSGRLEQEWASRDLFGTGRGRYRYRLKA